MAKYWNRLDMERMKAEEQRRELDVASQTAHGSSQATSRANAQEFAYEPPAGLILKHLRLHRDEIMRRHAELSSQGKVVNVEIECRLGTLVHGRERVGSFESGKEGAVVPGSRFCAGVAGVHHRQFIETAKREYERECQRLRKLGRALKPPKATLSDVWTPDDGNGRRSGRRYFRDAHPLQPHELSRGMKSINDRSVKQEIKHKDVCPDLDIHLPSHKYDLRVSVSIEEVVPEKVEADLSGVSFDRKKDRYSVVCVLPPPHSDLPMPEIDATEVLSRTASGALETTFEFELEANKEITAEYLSPSGGSSVLKLSQSLWYGLCSFIPQECNSSKLIRYAPWSYSDRCLDDIRGVKKWVLDQCGRSNDRFPGAMPVSLDRWKFKETLLKYSKDKHYVVGEKTDGVRHYLVVAAEKAFLVDREFSLFVCPGIDELAAGNSAQNGRGLPVGTILDGEIVRHRGLERDVFLAFDIISRGIHPTHQVSFKERRHLLEEVVRQFAASNPQHLQLPLPLLQKKFWPLDKLYDLNEFIQHEGIDCVYKHVCPSTNTEYNHKCDGFIFVHNDPYIFGTDTFMLKWKPVEDLSIDFLVVFENYKPKFYYSDENELLVDVTVLLHHEQGSQLSDHDIARLLADLNRYGQEQLTEDGLPYLIAEFAFDSETSAWHYMRPRTDKKKPNFRDTVLPGLLDIGLNISKEELMYRLLCAERDDKKGDKWGKELQAGRKDALDRKRKESNPAAAPPRQQQRIASEAVIASNAVGVSDAGSRK